MHIPQALSLDQAKCHTLFSRGRPKTCRSNHPRNRGIQSDIFENPMSKESKDGVRDKTDDIVERGKLGKLGMKEQPLIGQILSPAETTRYSALAATANFLAIDRGDIVYCAKELTRHMAAPTTADWEKVVRLGRYLKNRPGVRLWYKFQETPCQLETYSDTDWAGCRRTRRSTTGRYTVAGSHLIKMW